MNKIMLGCVAVVGCVSAAPGAAQVVKLDVTVRSEPGIAFSAPIFTFTNQSSTRLINTVSINGGPPWDYVYDGPAGPYQIANPAGGTRTLLIGQEANFNPNDGCTASISYGLTSFNPGDFFRFSTDPEGPGCGNAVVDIRPFLQADQIGIGVLFSNGLALSGSDWTKELIDPQGADVDSNQRWRLTLSAPDIAAVPEPATWGMMILGFGAMGLGMRRRTRVRVRVAI